LTGAAVLATPDEQALCKDRGYTVGTPSQWLFDECARVGPFTHQAEIPGLFRGQPSAMLRPLSPCPCRPRSGPRRNGVLEVEREQYDSKDDLERYGAAGQTLSQWLDPRLWQPLGAQTSALWQAGADGLERAGGNLNATARDWARLGVLLADDGVRPDKPQLGPLLPQDFLLEATDWKRHPEAFAPRKATPYYSYGYQVWTLPGAKGRFALLGVYGQAIYVDLEQKLVMAHLAANATARACQISMGHEVGALWHGIVAHQGRW
jgi:hypothetical protein